MDNEREKLIGARFRAFRETLQIPRSPFAVRIGYGSERIASYESGRAPLPYIVFIAALEKYSLSPQWLATGEGSPHWGANDEKDFIFQAPHSPRDSFSSVYKKHLSHTIAKTSNEITAKVKERISRLNRFNNLTKDINPDSLSENTVKRLVALIPHMERLNEILKADSELRKGVNSKISENNTLTKDSPKGNTAGVKSEIQKLIEQVKRKASKPGSKAELARELNVAPARISEWLSGEKEPGGEYTLRLLKWVGQS